MQQARGPVTDIVFDLGGVLVDWNPRHLLVSRLGGAADEVEHFLQTVCTSTWHLELDRGKPFETASSALLERHPHYRDWIAAYSQQWEGMFLSELQDAAQALDNWHERGLRLHALSNYPAEQIAFLYRRFGFMRKFHSVIVSGLIRTVKPERQIYDYLRSRIGNVRCVFIDDREENVTAARECGIEAIQFRDSADLRQVEALIQASA